jgi:hypothetical protein
MTLNVNFLHDCIVVGLLKVPRFALEKYLKEISLSVILDRYGFSHNRAPC